MKEKNECEFNKGDRVKRSDSNGANGTVHGIRRDSTATGGDKEDCEAPGLTISVLWDNGTLSHLVPSSLEKI